MSLIFLKTLLELTGWSDDDASFKSICNDPSITGVAHTPSRTGCSLVFTVIYDNNDSKYNQKIDYGTSTSYGSSTTGKSILGLEANTIYYYKIIATRHNEEPQHIIIVLELLAMLQVFQMQVQLLQELLELFLIVQVISQLKFNIVQL